MERVGAPAGVGAVAVLASFPRDQLEEGVSFGRGAIHRRALLRLPACTFTPNLCTHSVGGCYQLAGAHTLLLEGAGALWAATRHGEAVPCAHRRPDFAAWESPWLVLPACVFTLHIYSAHLLCTLTLLYFTPRTSALFYGAPSARPSLHLLPPL